jgi:hypothetical protein
MDSLYTVVAPIAAVGLVYVVVPVVADTYRRFRGKKSVVCPETKEPAQVELDAALVAARTAVGARVGPEDLRVLGCSRWPERHECGQECVAELKC